MKSFEKLLKGYRRFRDKYAIGDNAIMEQLADHGQTPSTLVISCCDSRVDPALILQSEPGDLFIVRNVANIVPPYEADDRHHGTSAALEFGICYLGVKHLVILGHSQCGGINARINGNTLAQDDFITQWVSLIELQVDKRDIDQVAREALLFSYDNCLTFPWLKERVDNKQLDIHLWFFDIKEGRIHAYSQELQQYEQLIAS